ncbi:hypothetical protein BH10ACT5_BH10ACT5_21650 [soil metagenome]
MPRPGCQVQVTVIALAAVLKAQLENMTLCASYSVIEVDTDFAEAPRPNAVRVTV